MEPKNLRIANDWKYREADWARLGFINRKARVAYQVPADLLIPGECRCGAMISEHTDANGNPVSCETLRYARASVYIHKGPARKALQDEVLRRARLNRGQS